jgi:hypothetical protein
MLMVLASVTYQQLISANHYFPENKLDQAFPRCGVQKRFLIVIGIFPSFIIAFCGAFDGRERSMPGSVDRSMRGKKPKRNRIKYSTRIHVQHNKIMEHNWPKQP